LNFTNNNLNQGFTPGGFSENLNPHIKQGILNNNNTYNKNESSSGNKLHKKQNNNIDMQGGLSRKKMICNFYVNGACNKGKECPFSHDGPQIKKTDLCKYFLTNNCLKGDECVYSHDTKSYPCKFFHAVGYCEKGENCR